MQIWVSPYLISLQCRRILARACILIKRAPSWIQTRRRLGERRKCVLGSKSRLKGEERGEEERKENPLGYSRDSSQSTLILFSLVTGIALLKLFDQLFRYIDSRCKGTLVLQ